MEEAAREAQEKDRAAAAAAAASEETEQAGSPGAATVASSSALPSGHKSPESDATVRRAVYEASKTELHGASEESIPDRVLKTATVSSKVTQASGSGRHESTSSITQAAILPVVEEATEGLSTAEISRNSHVSTLTADSDGRPLTPAKDGEESQAGFGNPLLGGYRKLSNGRGPPTPPKTGNGQQRASLKPQSADSGYGVTGGSVNGHALKSSTGSQKSVNIRSQVSRDSLDKALPPLPRGDAWPQETA